MLFGIFLFRLLCLLVSCDPVYKLPEIRSTPLDSVQSKMNKEKIAIRPLVTTRAGVVEGYHAKSMNGRVFFSFEGIPFGESTAGRRRWKPPLAKRPWQGIRQAKAPGKPCLQVDPFRTLQVRGSEDCLFLNVYTPDILRLGSNLSSDTFPVVVFIHGGAFACGTGSDYGPTYIMNEDVVVVTFNYRLSVMGFLSTGDNVLPGNYGLKDQALALKWVHENIEKFSGNPNNVTLLGNSAGGVSVNLHMIANKTRNYFSTAFSSSGTAFQHWAVQSSSYANRQTRRLAQVFGCNKKSNFDILKCLKRIDSNFLVAAVFNIYDWFPFPIIPFSPTVEPDHPDAFLTTWPEQAYKTGIVAKKPFVMGITKSEGRTVMMALLPLMKTFPLRVMWEQIAPHYLEYKNIVANPKEITRKVNNFYLKGSSPRNASLDCFVDMMSDRFLNFGVIKGLQAHVSVGAPSYLYYFSFSEGNHNFANMVGYKSSEWGAGHGEDISYFFNISLVVDGHKQDDPDHALSKIMIKLLVNFAKTGKPKFVTDDAKKLNFWEPIKNPSKLKALQFDKTVEMIEFPRREIERLRFWESLNLPNVTLWSPL